VNPWGRPWPSLRAIALGGLAALAGDEHAPYPLTGLRPDTKAVLTAFKKYGLILADNGSNWYFQGTADKRWPNALLDELKSIPANAFESVDTAPMEIHRGSGRARQ
jgi:hypothetical protein